MTTRAYVLLTVLGILFIALVWFVLWPGGRPLEVMTVERPSRPLSFIFTRGVIIDGVKVVRYETGPDGQTAERTIWQLEPHPDHRDERREEKGLMYGRRLRGLRIPPDLGAPQPLERGAKYRFELDPRHGRTVTLDFEPSFGQGR